MSSDATRLKAAAWALIVCGCLGCAQPKGPLFTPMTEAPRWPPPPAPTRVEYIGNITTAADLRPGRSFGAALGDVVFGKDADRSMLSPYGLCTDDNDRLFVSDSNAQMIHVINLATRIYEQWSPETGGLAQPLGVAWDPAGRLLVADSAGARLVVFDGSGRMTGTIGDGVLQRPSGLAVDSSSGRIFVADPPAHKIVVFDRDGRFIQRIGTRGVGVGEFNFPTQVVLGADGHLFVADSLNFRVQRFDPALTPMGMIGAHGDSPGSFSQPKGIALDGDGQLYVVDAHFEAVQIFDDAGQLLLTFGREGHGPGEFWLPAGIHIDQTNRIWIADTYNRRVQVFQYLGVPDA